MSNTITIKNENLTVEISTYGAELQSVKGTDGAELLWCGDPEIWSGKAPVLFPICGGLKEDKYKLGGEEYSLPKHGFARISEFECEFNSDACAVFLLTSTAETLAQYPFEFEFRITYTLKEKSIDVKYEVKNLSDRTMYFSLGAHESYSCPGGIEEYSICFDKPQTLNASRIDGNLLAYTTDNIITDINILNLKQEYFAVDALVFTDIDFERVSLKKNDGTREIIVDFPGYKYLLLWTKPNADYICIEPWCGIPDRIDSDCDFTKKEGIIALEPQNTYSNKHTVTVVK